MVVKRAYAAEAGCDSWKVGLSGADRCIVMDCGTTNGSGSRISFPAGRATLAAPRRTIGFSWRLSSIAIERASRGVTFRSASAPGRNTHRRLRRWCESGVFARIFKALAEDRDNEYMMIDATIVRAHQHSAGARKKGGPARPSADREAG